MRDKIGTLNSSASKIGHGLTEKMRVWLSESAVKIQKEQRRTWMTWIEWARR
jgi:hypothetical protein